MISSSYVNSNWSYSPETVKLGCDLCDLDLWPLTLTFCMGITSVIGNNSWKFRDDAMMGTWSKRCDRRTDRQSDRQTENTVHRAAWSQLKILLLWKYVVKLVSVDVEFWVLCYWYKLVNLVDNSRICKVMYDLLLKMYVDLSYKHHSIDFIKTTIDNLGLSFSFFNNKVWDYIILNLLSTNVLKIITFNNGMLKYPQRLTVFVIDDSKPISNLKII